MKDPMAQMKQDFIADASETIQDMSRSLAALEPGEPVARSQVDLLFRTAHSLKGTAGMFELHAVSRVAEAIENLLDLVRGERVLMDGAVVDLLLEALDEIAILLEQPTGDDAENLSGVVAKKIEAFLRSVSVPADSRSGAEHADTKSGRKIDELRSKPGHSDRAGSGGPKTEDTRKRRSDTRDIKGASTSRLAVKVDIEVLDSIMNTVSELYSVWVGLQGIAKRLPRNIRTRRLRDDLLKLNLLLHKRISDLEGSATSVRLVPISMLFERYRGEVRRLARQAGKRVKLEFEGESTRMDRALLERLHDPLLHIIRNAVGHGIESEAERIATGKDGQGIIMVRARQDANHIRVDVQDNGRGIDVQRITSVATGKGIGIEDGESPLALIFKPGMSTKEDADEISGRGVGLDAAKTMIEGMRGMITVDTKPGEGTKFSIWVPLTLAVSRGILVEEAGVPTVIPLGSVIEVLRLSRSLRKQIEDTGVLKYKDVEISTVGLSRMLGIEQSESAGFIVIVGVGEKRRGIVVQGVCGETDIVSRPLPDVVIAPRFVTGAAELDDGRTAIIIQPEEILRGRVGQDRTEIGAANALLLPASASVGELKRGGMFRLLIFRSGGELFGISVALLSEVFPAGRHTRIPALGSVWQGLFFLRGMCHCLIGIPGLEPSVYREMDNIIVLKSPERCGVAASDVLGHFAIPYENVKRDSRRDELHQAAQSEAFEWEGKTVRILDVLGILRNASAGDDGKAGGPATMRAPREALMQTPSVDDR